MPIYEFECLECGAEFEKLVFKPCPASEVACPACEGRNIEEKVSAFSSVSRAGSGPKSAACAPSGG